jgi:hypothetical protein
MEIDERAERGGFRRGLYRRDLPGGGYVAIEVTQRDDSSDRRGHRGGGESAAERARISVERRVTEERRFGHEPPIVAEVPGDDPAQLGELFKIAADNAALARALLQWQLRRSRETAVPLEQWEGRADC